MSSLGNAGGQVPKSKSSTLKEVKHPSLHHITFLLGEFMQFGL